MTVTLQTWEMREGALAWLLDRREFALEVKTRKDAALVWCLERYANLCLQKWDVLNNFRLNSTVTRI
jgi:hypothetical protein